MKKCIRCEIEKEDICFTIDNKRKDKLCPYCKECDNTRHRLQYSENKEQYISRNKKQWQKIKNESKEARTRRLHRKKDKRLKLKYGISLEEKYQLYLAQDKKCKICNLEIPFSTMKGSHLDHNHSTQRIRGILCRSCNTAIGLLKDDYKIMFSAFMYLFNDSLELEK